MSLTTKKKSRKTATKTSKSTVTELKQELTGNYKDKYIFMEDTIKLLEVAYDTGNNAVLWGLGGHGKSEVTIDFFKEKGIKPYIITMGAGMSLDRLFGGVDIAYFNKSEGEIHYKVEHSFMNYEYVIFEEVFDTPEFVLEQLKDILSSGVFRNGNQVFEIKTKLIIGNTNHDRNDYATNTSLKALMERFPLSKKVEWPYYNMEAYKILFEAKGQVPNKLVCFVLEEFAKKKHVVSPRIALKANDLVNRYGPDAFTMLAEFENKKQDLSKFINACEAINKIDDHMAKILDYNNQLNALDISNIKDLADLKKVIKLKQKLYAEYLKLDTITVVDNQVSYKTDAQNKAFDFYNIFQDLIANIKKDLNL